MALGLKMIRSQLPRLFCQRTFLACNGGPILNCKQYSTENLSPKEPVKGPISWKALGISLTLGGSLVAYMLYLKAEKDKMKELSRKQSIGKILVGGEWDLTNHLGKPTSSKDYLGQWLLLYFGFTHCPDICPDELEKMCSVSDIINKDEDYPSVVPLFITVDPERDGVEVVKKYVEEFSPSLIGLTGTKEQVEKACKEFRVYHSEGPRDVDNDYIVDHTIIMYLINPDGQFVDYFGQRRTAEEVATAVRSKMLVYEAKRRKSLWAT